MARALETEPPPDSRVSNLGEGIQLPEQRERTDTYPGIKSVCKSNGHVEGPKQRKRDMNRIYISEQKWPAPSENEGRIEPKINIARTYISDETKISQARSVGSRSIEQPGQDRSVDLMLMVEFRSLQLTHDWRPFVDFIYVLSPWHPSFATYGISEKTQSSCLIRVPAFEDCSLRNLLLLLF